MGKYKVYLNDKQRYVEGDKNLNPDKKSTFFGLGFKKFEVFKGVDINTKENVEFEVITTINGEEPRLTPLGANEQSGLSSDDKGFLGTKIPYQYGLYGTYAIVLIIMIVIYFKFIR